MRASAISSILVETWAAARCATREAVMPARMAVILVAASVAAFPPRPLSAQDTTAVAQHARSGFWLSLGLGGGARTIECAPLCSEQPGQGTSGSLAIGGTISPRWLVGAQVVGWAPWNAHETFWNDRDGYQAIFLAVRHYLKATGNTYISGGIGGGGLRLVEDLLQTHGWAVYAAAGHDLRLWRRYSLTPYVELLQSFDEEPAVAYHSVDGRVRVRLLQFGVAFTLH
jgi:hypothetical protein